MTPLLAALGLGVGRMVLKRFIVPPLKGKTLKEKGHDYSRAMFVCDVGEIAEWNKGKCKQHDSNPSHYQGELLKKTKDTWSIYIRQMLI